MSVFQQMFEFFFRDLEEFLFRELQMTVAEILKEMLDEVDRTIKEARDKKLFKEVSSQEITISTLFRDITFKRGYYKNTETNRYVHLSDEVLCIDRGISPCLAAVAPVEAVIAPSYRALSKKF